MAKSDFSCPLPGRTDRLVTLAHGAGGMAMQHLISQFIAPLYEDGFAPDHDGAVFEVGGKIAFTTDSFVIKPMFFPGGDIGKLAVYGTVNDLAMCGARPLFLSCSFILEEGLPLDLMQAVCQSIKMAVGETGVRLVTGDTKVVGRGQGDGLYINMAGIGVTRSAVAIHPRSVRPGDSLILSGDLGRHGIAVMAAREGIELADDLTSDCAPLHEPVEALLTAGVKLKCLRDLTRGGLAAALLEIAAASAAGIEIDEQAVPVMPSVRAVCEILGLDPLYVANEGRFLLFVEADDTSSALAILKTFDVCAKSTVIGRAIEDREVAIISAYGARRPLPPMVGELLPRIC